MNIVDLRSDTVTRPTPAMRAAMAAAELGDDVFGDDPTVNALQERIAALLGKEAALFVPSGTQSNLVAVMSHCGRGDEYIVGQMAHTYRWEGGGAAVLGSVQPQPLEHQPDGSLALAAIEAAIKPNDSHFARSRLLCLENTIGGKVLPLDYLAQATALARARGLATHLDGARLFNAAVALAAAGPGAQVTSAAAIERARAMAAHFDTVSVCFSKGLGAPVGSALVGPKALIEGAHRWRKMLGGGMRQGGVLAAAGLHALEHHVARLAEDHARARRLADGLQGLAGLVVQPPQSNMVFAEVRGERANGLVEHLRSRGVLAIGLYQLRFVTHLDVDDDGIDRAVAAVREHLER
jgi:threonine aldolase